jgi:hypothetical protein
MVLVGTRKHGARSTEDPVTHKKVLFHAEAHEKVLRGAAALADAVRD